MIMSRGNMRQRYHFMPQTGWMNDPNGLVYFKGQYHFFYQHYPHAPEWHSMHWGHAVSSDLLHWEYLPLALMPDAWYDKDEEGSCFSGSAIVHESRLYLMYTGSADHGNGIVQTQCMAVSEDGVHFKKFSNNPVITAPPGCDVTLFRDPKIWKYEEHFYVVIGASRDNKAQALLYRSGDLEQWEYVGVLAESRGELGFMWECPDFFPLGDKYVLTFSPMGTGDRKAVYLVGDMDYAQGKFHYHNIGEIDWGMDFYAPQSFAAPDGRRLMVGWANEWDWMPWFKDFGATRQEGWCGSFNLIREVRLNEDNSLSFYPAQEYQQLRHSAAVTRDLTLTQAGREFRAGDGVAYECRIRIDLTRTTASAIQLKLRGNGQEYTRIVFDIRRGEMFFDRSQADGWSRGCSRSPLILPDKEKMEIHIFADQSSIEVFTDGYRTAHSANVYADQEHNSNQIQACDGQLYIEAIESWALKKPWIRRSDRLLSHRKAACLICA